MIEKLTAFGARRWPAVLVAALALVVLGDWARRSLVADAIPDLSEPQIAVVVAWPAHPAPEVAERVTEPLTGALAGLSEAAAVHGASMTGLAYVDVVLAAGVGLHQARGAIARRLEGSRLPGNARVRLGPEASSTGWVFQYALVAPEVREAPHGDGTTGVSLLTLRRLQDEVLAPALAAIPGVAEVASLGGGTGEVDVIVKPDRLRALGLALSDVRRAVSGAAAPTYATLASLPVAAAGGPAHPLGELARVRGAMVMAEGMADVDGALPVVAGTVVARRDADPAAVCRRVAAALAGLRARLPPGVELVTVYDRSQLGRRVGRTLLRALGEELAVVALVVVAFLLHGRSALVPVGSLLVVLALTFLAMRAFGLPADVMSLGGIAIALGLAVDADLVTLEACHRRLTAGTHGNPGRTPMSNPVAGGERRQELIAAARAFAPAIATSLAIAALAFLPALAFTGESGRLLRPLVLTKTFVVAAAIPVALLVAPALRELLVRGRIRRELENPLTRALVAAYRPIVRFALERPAFTLAAVALGALSCVPLLGHLGGEFLPRIDEGDLLYMPTTSPDVPASLAAAELARQDRLLARRPEVALVFGKLGRAATATDPAPCSMAETLVRLKPRARWPPRFHARFYSRWAPPALARVLRRLWPEQRPDTTAELVAELDLALRAPGWSNAWTAPVRARIDMMATGVRTPVGIRITAADARRLDELGARVHSIVAALPETRSAVYESLGGESHLDFVPDAAALARWHVDEAQVRDIARLMLTDGWLGDVDRDGRQLPMRLVADVTARPPDELVRDATVASRDGPVPLALLGRVITVREPAMLRNEGGLPAAYVYVDVADGTDLERYVVRGRRAIAAAVASGSLALRQDEAIEWTGQYRLLSEGRRRLALIAPLVALSMLALLVLQLGSVIEALIVLGAVPFALVGAVWTIYLAGYRMSAPVWVGLLSVVGLAMQTGVVLVVYIDEAFFRRVREGRMRTPADVIAAHTDGTVRRLRPKVMTVVTMGAALLPLLWAEGAGAEIMKRVAAPMVGGLASSAFVTLEVIPVLYTIWRRRQLRAAERSGRALAVVLGRPPPWARGP